MIVLILPSLLTCLEHLRRLPELEMREGIEVTNLIAIIKRLRKIKRKYLTDMLSYILQKTKKNC